MTISNDVDFHRLRNNGNEIIRIARVYGYPLPDGWDLLQELRSEAQKLTTEAEPVAAVTALPAPGKVKEWCTRQATARQQHRERVAIARELYDRLDRDSIRAALEHASEVCTQLVTDVNTKLLPRLTELLTSAPRILTGHESADQLADHSELLRTVGEVSQAAQDRAQLALALGEAETLGRDGAVFLLIDPPAAVTYRAVDQAVIDIRDGLPTTLDQWAKLAPLELHFADAGRADRRLAEYGALRGALLNTDDGGMFDHTLAELAGITNDPNAAQRRAQRVA